jgi:iron(III) transport system substrate-binding protein
MLNSVRQKSSVALVGVIFFLAGCAGATDTVSEAEDVVPAEETTEVEAVEGVSDNYVVLYSGRKESLVQPLIDTFTEQTGIEVDVRYAGTTELAAQLLEEGDQSPASVFLSQDGGALGALTDAGLFEILPLEISDRVDPSFTSQDGSWVGVTGRARVIVYDSSTVTEEELPQTATELVGEQWTGKVGVAPPNASFQSFVTAYRVIAGEEAADQWVSDLSNNDPQIFENNGAILEAVNEGEVPLGLINHYYWYRMEAERGADNMKSRLHFTAPGDPASIVNVSGAGILAAQSGDLDALELVEFLVSDQGQEYFVTTTYEYPLVPGIAAPAGLPLLTDLATADFDLSDLRTLSETQDILRNYGLIF